DQASFAQEVTSLAAALGMDASAKPALDLAREIGERVEAAITARTAKSKAAKEIQAARDRRDALAEPIAIQARRKTAITGHFGVATLPEAGARLRDIARRRDLQAQADAAAREILDLLRAATIAEAETALESADRAALVQEMAELAPQFEARDQD